MNNIPDLKALRLCTIYCDGSNMLVSLTYRVIICDDKNGRGSFHDDIPHVDLGSKLEQEIARDAGLPDGDDFPGWDAVFDYLDNHRELIQ